MQVYARSVRRGSPGWLKLSVASTTCAAGIVAFVTVWVGLRLAAAVAAVFGRRMDALAYVALSPP